MNNEAEQYIGMSMTYTLLEYVKENLQTLLTNQPETEDIAPSSSSSQLCDSMKNATLEGMNIYYTHISILYLRFTINP